MIWHLFLKPIWRALSGWWCDPYRRPLRDRWTMFSYRHRGALSRLTIAAPITVIIGGLVALAVMLT